MIRTRNRRFGRRKSTVGPEGTYSGRATGVDLSPLDRERIPCGIRMGRTEGRGRTTTPSTTGTKIPISKRKSNFGQQLFQKVRPTVGEDKSPHKEDGPPFPRSGYPDHTPGSDLRRPTSKRMKYLEHRIQSTIPVLSLKTGDR